MDWLGRQSGRGGEHPEDLSDGGYVLTPTLVDAAADDKVLIDEETFGPVNTVFGFEDTDEIMVRANPT